MTQRPVRIIGAGIGGLTLGRCLLNHGIPAVLYEKVRTTHHHNYGITLHASSYRPLLDLLGLDERTFRRRIAVDGPLGGNGNIEPRSMAYPGKVDSTSFRAHRGKLEMLLREGLDIRWEHAVEKVEESSSGMMLCLRDGRKLDDSAYIVSVDGPHSNVRQSLSSNTALRVLPYVTFNGRRSVDQALFDSVYAPAMQRSNVVEAKQSDVVLDVSVNGRQGNSVRRILPKSFFEQVRALRDLEQPFEEVFDAEKMRTERVLHCLMRTFQVSRQELRALAEKGIFLLGDAAHAEPILGGEGANNAITDAIELGKCISAFGMDGVPAWYDSRYPEWEAGGRRSEGAIAEMHSSQKAAL